MPINPPTRVVGANQIALSGGAVTLGNGAQMVTAVAIGNAAGTAYKVGDIVAPANDNGYSGQIYITSISTGGVVTGVSLTYGANEQLPPYYSSGNTPGTTNIATTAAFPGSTSGSGLTLNLTYNGGGSNPIPPAAKAALIEASIIANVAVLYTGDGSTPTATFGNIINAGNTVLRDDLAPGNTPLSLIQLIGATSSAVCVVEFRGA